MAKLIITRGLPASGKTTWAKKYVEAGKNRTRICRDDIRFNYMGIDPSQGVGDQDQESMVTRLQEQMVETYLVWGWDVVVDDTNLPQKTANRWAKVAQRCRADFEAIDFTHIEVDVCVQRDLNRGFDGQRWVGSEVITRMHDKYLSKGRKLAPVMIEAEPTLRQYTPDESLPPCWLFDIDGTLALMGNRSPYEWHKVGMDDVNEWVRDILHALAPKATIVIMSGRDSACRDVTESWLRRNDIPYAELHMRAQGDQRKDSIVKAELFWENVGEKYNVLGVFDDRNQVVEMWRNMGVKVAQVAPGDF